MVVLVVAVQGFGNRQDTSLIRGHAIRTLGMDKPFQGLQNVAPLHNSSLFR